MDYPIGENEVSRVAALRALQIVGTPPTAAFDAIAQLAAETFGCPIAFISLLEENEQWFKAECGLGHRSTSRDIAFCNYTILGTEAFVVEDALDDARFSTNPLVTGPPHVRFYAGIPITTDSGYPIGALCVNDTRPRQFSQADIARLRKFGKIAEGLVAAHDQAVRAAAAAHEVAEKAQLLWKKNRLLQQVERIGKVGGWELDIESNEVEWSDEVARIHELPIGKQYQLEEALSYYPEPWRSLVSDNVERTKVTGKPYDFESQFVTPLGHKKWVRAAGDCEHRDGKPVRLFGMFQDVTLEKQASERLWQAANFDDLTGLPNRRHFNRAIGSAIEQAGASGTAVTLIMLDLDNFKEVNDTRGHAVGDKILAEIGRRLKSLTPHAGIVARLGGDEFALLATGNISDKDILEMGKRILADLKPSIHIGSTHIYIGGTLGAARFPANASNASDLLRKADLALYAAKETCRGSLRLYSHELDTLFERHARAIDMVRGALAKGRLVPFYQPKVRLYDRSLCGFEALARVVTGDGSIVTPSAFAAALDDRVMARRIGKKMLHAVTAHIASWRDAGLEPHSVSLNVGEADFTDGKLAHRVLQRLDELGLPHSCLTIEVTESVFLGNGAILAREALQALDHQGVKIELDDFGTGYASLTHLRAYPVSRLKIDRSFIESLAPDADSRVIVQAVIDLAHNLNCEIVAEGVETANQADILRKMGCDAAQGYLFGHPVSSKQTGEFLMLEATRQQERLRAMARHSSKEISGSSNKLTSKRMS
jgi:diguanylate cyclase (GGDEF)-like protein